MYFSVVKHEGGKKMTLDIGEKIKTSRKEAGFTQEDAADGIGVSRQTILSWENNKSYPDIISVMISESRT